MEATSGGAPNTAEYRQDGSISSRADGITNTVSFEVVANTANKLGIYGNRLTISGETSNGSDDAFVIDTMVMVDAASGSIISTDIGSTERLGNDTLGSGKEQVTIGTPTHVNSTAYSIPINFKNTSNGSKALQWHIVNKVYSNDTELKEAQSSVS